MRELNELKKSVDVLEETVKKNGNVVEAPLEYKIDPAILLQIYKEKRQMYVNTWHASLLDHKIAVATADETAMTAIKKRLKDVTQAIDIIDKEIVALE